MAADNYYEILGVAKDATPEEIKSAYRKLAKTNHPDAFATASDEEKRKAEAKFKKINEAYEVLSDETKRSNFDNYGDPDASGAGFGGDGGFGGFGGFGGGGFGGSGGINFEDIISSIFGGGFGGARTTQAQSNRPMTGSDITEQVTLSFEEAAFGVDREIRLRREEACPDCKGTGAKNGTAFKTCEHCGGKGRVNMVQNTPFGRVQQTGACPYCKGKGKVVSETCKTCGGKGRIDKTVNVRVSIPAGIDNGQVMTMYNEGNAGYNGGEKGNLVIKVVVKPHKLFVRDGFDMRFDMPITFAQAALGCKVEVPTLGNPVEYDIPAGTQTGTVFKIKNEGIRYLRKEQKGDLYMKVVVETPKSLTKEQKEMINKLQGTFDRSQHPKQKAYKEKL